MVKGGFQMRRDSSTDFDERWLQPNGVVPVDPVTTGILIREIQNLRHDLDRAMANHNADLNASCGPLVPVIPEGWALVPWKPTKRMLEVGDGLCCRVGDGPLQKVQYPPALGPEDVYECMVAAAPDYASSATVGSK